MVRVPMPFFCSIDDSGCITTSVSVLAGDGKAKPGGPQGIIGLFIEQIDNCQEKPLTLIRADSLFAPLEPGALQVDNQLNSATR